MSVATPQVVTGEVRNAIARANLAFFAQDFLGMEIGEHHVDWSRVVNEHRQIDILAARGHGKSGFFSYAYPLWKSWATSGNRGLVVSDTSDQVEELFRIIKEGVTHKDELGFTWSLPAVIDTKIAHLVPAKFERTWTGSKISFNNGSRFIGRTFGRRFRGTHVPWIVIDDPHGDDASYSEVTREKDWAFLKATIEPMLLNGGQICIVGTPLHSADIHGRTSKLKGWHQAAYPAVRQVDGREELLWPDFRPRHYLEGRRASMGELLFRQEYLLIPASSEASLFPPSLFRDRPEVLAHWLRLRPSDAETRARDGWTYYAGVDIAMSAEVAADYFVLTVIGVDDYGNRHIVELHREKGLAFHRQIRLIEDVLRPYQAIGGLVAVYVEANQAQRVWGDELIRKTDLPVTKYITGVERNSLAKGVPTLRVLFENGKIRLPRADSHSREMTDVLMAELGSFGWLNGKMQGVGSHDDTVMSLWLADRAVHGSGGLVVFGQGGAGFSGSLTGRDALSVLSGPAPTADADGKVTMIKAGLIPQTCTLPDEVAGPLAWREARAGRSPCERCTADRSVCLGGPPNAPGQIVIIEEAQPAPPPVPPPPKPPEGEAAMPMRMWLDLVEACGGDAALARTIPTERSERIIGWNSLLGAGAPPPWVEHAMQAGKGPALYTALQVALKG